MWWVPARIARAARSSCRGLRVESFARATGRPSTRNPNVAALGTSSLGSGQSLILQQNQALPSYRHALQQTRKATAVAATGLMLPIGNGPLVIGED